MIANIAEICSYQVFFYDDTYPQIQAVEHWQIVGTFADLLESSDTVDAVVVAIGDNGVRARKGEALISAGANLISLIHPSAVVSGYAEIGHGTVVFPGAVINAFARIGNHVIINTGAIIEHDCEVGDAVHVSPNSALGGKVIIDDFAWIGIGSCVCPSVRIGKNTIVGAGSNVIRDIPPNVIAYGSPARAITKR